MTGNRIVDEVQEVRQRLVKKHGGLRGYVKYLQEVERRLEAEEAVKKSRRKSPLKAGKISAKAASKSQPTVTAPKRSGKRKAS